MMSKKNTKSTYDLIVPRGCDISLVQVGIGSGFLSYSKQKALSEGHIKPVNVSLGRYKIVVSEAAESVKVTIVAKKKTDEKEENENGV
jgi:hypothetical protein